MKEWIMQNLDATVIAAVITSLSSLVAGIISLVSIVRKSKQSKLLQQALQDAKLRRTYHVCPKCGEKTALNDMHFYLEDGSKDDNLNGVPDRME